MPQSYQEPALALRFLFLDESGNLDFSPKGTRYFGVTSITVETCDCGNSLVNLRRCLALEGISLVGEFHATEDFQHVRDRVFQAISEHDLRIDTTLVEKKKVAEHLRSDASRFYKQMLFQHLNYVVPKILENGDALLVVCAALGTRRDREVHRANLQEVIGQVQPQGTDVRYAFWPSAIEPCLQVADYCSWAIHRKWERDDQRSYVLIADKIASEFELF